MTENAAAHVRDFVFELRELQRACGGPTFGDLKRISGEVKGLYGLERMEVLLPSTCSMILSAQRKRLPRWSWVVAFVLSCQRYGHVYAGLLSGDPGKDTLPLWREWWLEPRARSMSPVKVLPVAQPRPVRADERLLPRLGERLRTLREQAGLERARAAFCIRATASKIGRLERGEVAPRAVDALALLDLYGVDPAGRAEVMLMVTRAGAPWRHPFRDLVHPSAERLHELESGALRLSHYEPRLVPWPLRTEEYARAVAALPPGEPDSRELDRRVEFHRWRSSSLADTDVLCVLDEAALGRRIGSDEVMAGQLRHLAEGAAPAGVDLRVVPAGRTGPGPRQAFTLLEFAEDPAIVSAEHLHEVEYLDDPDQVERYRRELDRLTALAHGPAATRAFIKALPLSP